MESPFKYNHGQGLLCCFDPESGENILTGFILGNNPRDIKKFQRAFDMIVANSDNLFFERKGNFRACLTFEFHAGNLGWKIPGLSQRTIDFSMVWGRGGFGIIVTGYQLCDFLKELYNAFLKGDISLWFDQRGLVIAIASKYKQKQKTEVFR